MRGSRAVIWLTRTIHSKKYESYLTEFSISLHAFCVGCISHPVKKPLRQMNLDISHPRIVALKQHFASRTVGTIVHHAPACAHSPAARSRPGRFWVWPLTKSDFSYVFLCWHLCASSYFPPYCHLATPHFSSEIIKAKQVHGNRKARGEKACKVNVLGQRMELRKK